MIVRIRYNDYVWMVNQPSSLINPTILSLSRYRSESQAIVLVRPLFSSSLRTVPADNRDPKGGNKVWTAVCRRHVSRSARTGVDAEQRGIEEYRGQASRVETRVGDTRLLWAWRLPPDRPGFTFKGRPAAALNRQSMWNLNVGACPGQRGGDQRGEIPIRIH